MIMEAKKKIIYILVAFSVILLLLNAILGNYETGKTEDNPKDDFLTQSKIEKYFDEVLTAYGIQKNWIKKKHTKKQYDSLKYKYEVQIPSSVSIPMILKELSLKLNYKNINITSTENETKGFTNLQIKSGGKIKLFAELKYNHTLQRPFSRAAFILVGTEDLPEDEFKRLLLAPYKFGVLLPLRNSSRQIAETVMQNGRNYFINLDDDAEKLSFQLDEDFGVSELKRNIASIVSSFNTPKYYFVGKKRTGFSNTFINHLTEEFAKKKRKVFRLDSFLKLKGEDDNDLRSLLDFHLKKIPYGKGKIYFLDVDDWQAIQPVLNSYLKKGNKIVQPGILLNSLIVKN